MPSAKLAFSFSLLRFSKGSTAIDFSGMGVRTFLGCSRFWVESDQATWGSVPFVRNIRKPRATTVMIAPATIRYFGRGDPLRAKPAAIAEAALNLRGTS